MDSTPDPEQTMVEINDLTVRANKQPICRVHEFVLERGNRVVITGDNGSGKTTLLRTIAGLEKVYSGKLLSKVNSNEIILVHQTPYLFNGTVKFNLEFGLRARGVKAAKRKELVSQWLEEMEIDALECRHVKQLSGGERRRVAFARAAICSPALLLLDEPFAELDVPGIKTILLCIRKLKATTAVIASPVDLKDYGLDTVVSLNKLS